MDSGTSFTGSAVAIDAQLPLRATFTQRETGDVPFVRAMETVATGGSATGAWTEPSPHEAATAHGLAIDFVPGEAWASTPSGVWRATLPPADDLGDRVIACRYRIEPGAARATLELDNADGALAGLPNGDYPATFVGAALDIWPGYRSGAGGEAEHGVRMTFVIDAITFRVEDGRRTVRIEASGAWEQLERWRAPQAWQVAAGQLSRAQLFARIAARAGVPTTDGGTSTEWSAHEPAFALIQGESAASALRRLLAPVADVARSGEGDGLEVLAIAPDDAPLESYGAPGQHPVAALVLTDARRDANWLRVHGADRYADAADFDSLYEQGPTLRTLRNPAATDNASATLSAEAALHRNGWREVRGELLAPFHAGQQLFDAIAVTCPAAGIEDAQYRVISCGLDYRRGRGVRYDSVLELGAL